MSQVMRAIGHPMVFALALLLLASLAAVAYSAWKQRRASRVERATKRLAIVAIAMSLLFISYVTLVPRGLGRPSTLSLIPLVDTARGLFDSVTFQVTVVGVVGNIALFVPLGFAITLMHGQTEIGKIAVVSALVLSILIESAQFMMNQGAAATVDDVCANVAGGALGWLVARWLNRKATAEPTGVSDLGNGQENHG